VGRLDATQQLRRRVRRVLAGLGADEAWTASIVDPAEQRLAGVDAELVCLANPMVAEESVMRGGLLPGLLSAARHNASHRNGSVRLFEIGDVFAAGVGPGGSRVPEESERVALLLGRDGDDAAAAIRAWRVLADSLGIAGVEVVQGAEASSGLAGLHPSRSGLLVVAERPEAVTEPSELAPGTVLGSVGEVDPEVLAAFGLPHERAGWLEVRLEWLALAPRRSELARLVSRYPSSDVDLAFAVDEQVPAQRLVDVIGHAAGELCESVELFDVYRGPGVPEGRRSLAVRLRLCALDHTLTDAEVADVRRRCVEAAEAALPATLRT